MKARTFTFMMAALLVPFAGYSDSDDDRIPTLTVDGEAVLYKPADLLTITLGVVTEDANASKALDANRAKMQDVMAKIQNLGLGKGEYQTSRFTITPIYSQPPKNMPQDWEPKILSYRVSNALAIRTEKTDLAGNLIDAATQAGVNQIEQIAFTLKDPRSYRAEAIKAATDNAIEDATTLAEAANIRLEKVLDIVLDPDNAPQPMFKTALMAAPRGSTPIESGDIAIQARVRVVYEIEGEQ